MKRSEFRKFAKRLRLGKLGGQTDFHVTPGPNAVRAGAKVNVYARSVFKEPLWRTLAWLALDAFFWPSEYDIEDFQNVHAATLRGLNVTKPTA